jgi:N-acetylglutamate synthase-like GNAT family acetyltransferase
MPFSTLVPGGFAISDDPLLLDLGVIHRFLSQETYWAKGRSRKMVERSIAHSLSLGAYASDGEQVGFAQVIGDRTTFAQLSNVFVLPAWRGRKLAEGLVAAALEHPELTTVTHWILRTKDAHGLYQKFGFSLTEPDVIDMELHRNLPPAT